MGELVALNPTFAYRGPINPKGLRQELAQICCSLFDRYYEYQGETRRETLRFLLVGIINFYQADSLVKGLPENNGLAERRYIRVLRNVLAMEGVNVIPPLPQEVYAALP
jgi:hypothetical protein